MLILSVMLVISAVCVTISINPVFSLLFLILSFVCSSGILILIGLDFYAMTFIIVYVGAIAVLFLFVIMMLNINITIETTVRYLPIGGLIGLFLLLELLGNINNNVVSFGILEESLNINDWLSSKPITVIESVGELLYSYSVYYFILASLVLLVAMIGSIVLTLQKNPYYHQQEVYEQNVREFSKTLLKYRELEK